MKVYVDKKMMGRLNYPKLLDEFKFVDFVESVDDYEIEVMVIMNSTIKNINVENYKNLKWVQLLMAGYDNVDIDKFKKNNILVSNARDIFSISIAEDVFSKILYFNRNTKYYLEGMVNKSWQPIPKEPEIFNSNVLILGSGSIGQEVAKRMKAFGAKKIVGYKRTLEKVEYFDEIINQDKELDSALEKADYVIIALPLTKETYHMIDEHKLSLMKSSSVLINVARGDIIDQDALIKALKQKRIRGAGLDVTSPEPLPKDNELWQLENVFITPHNASSSPYMKERLYQLTRENLKIYLSGKLPKYFL